MDFYQHSFFYNFFENLTSWWIVLNYKFKTIFFFSKKKKKRARRRLKNYLAWCPIFHFSVFKLTKHFKYAKNHSVLPSLNSIKLENEIKRFRSSSSFFFFCRNFLFYNFLISNLVTLCLNLKKKNIYWLQIYKQVMGDGLTYIRGLLIIFCIDAAVTDDEPLWEPIEWSLVQTWLFFIFVFAWIGENLIASRYGNYTGRDKRVWFAWYKTFWLLELWYALSYGTAALFVIVPFYYELTYNVSFVFSWWNWYTRIFFFKFISLFSLILLIGYLFQLNIRWLNWKKLLIFVLIINFFIGYLLYINFVMTFFGYFTDPLWYQKTRFIDYVQLSHEPLKWGWGPTKRDHFTYHKVSTVFWFKNDGPFASAFLMFHIFFFLSVLFLYFYWLTLLRRIYTTKEVTYTLSTYCVSSLRQFLLFFFLFYGLVIFSYITNYWRFPIEFLWVINPNSWFINFLNIMKDYSYFLINLI